jgi:hypothetical protein
MQLPRQQFESRNRSFAMRALRNPSPNGATFHVVDQASDVPKSGIKGRTPEIGMGAERTVFEGIGDGLARLSRGIISAWLPRTIVCVLHLG